MATPEYDKNNCTRYNLKLNNKTDADVIEKLKQVENVQGYIKGLIRKDMERQRTETAEQDLPPTGKIECPLVNGGFQDDEAMAVAERENHRIQTEFVRGRWELTIDLDARKVIRQIDHK